MDSYTDCNLKLNGDSCFRLTLMSAISPENENERILAAALSAILGKEILPEFNILAQTQQHVNKISWFDHHLTSFVYGKIGKSKENEDESLLPLHITVLATRTMFNCIIECDANVDKLKKLSLRKQIYRALSKI